MAPFKKNHLSKGGRVLVDRVPANSRGKRKIQCDPVKRNVPGNRRKSVVMGEGRRFYDRLYCIASGVRTFYVFYMAEGRMWEGLLEVSKKRPECAGVITEGRGREGKSCRIGGGE